MTADVTFIGIDLAWKAGATSGAAAIRGTQAAAGVVEIAEAEGDDGVLAFINKHAGQGPAIIAIDAPLIIANEDGQRPCERAIGQAFGRYEASAHSSNRRRMAQDGVVRGEALVNALAERGFTHAHEIAPGVPVRQVIEVYPHPAMVSVFGLERTLKYKKKYRRPVRNTEWQRYQEALGELEHADPALTGQREWVTRAVPAMKGQGLMSYEDQTDALFCAYIALFGYRWGESRCRAFGDMNTGYIYTPVPG